MIDSFLHILQTPFLFSALGAVAATALFVSPVLYNGDYKLATKSIVIVGIFFIFSTVLHYSHLSQLENSDLDRWIQPIYLEALVAISYILGLYIGVSIHRNVVHKK